jgi:hypothetical protein
MVVTAIHLLVMRRRHLLLRDHMLNKGLGKPVVNPRDRRIVSAISNCGHAEMGAPSSIGVLNGRQHITAEIVLGIKRFDFGLGMIEGNPLHDRRLRLGHGRQNKPQQMMARPTNPGHEVEITMLGKLHGSTPQSHGCWKSPPSGHMSLTVTRAVFSHVPSLRGFVTKQLQIQRRESSSLQPQPSFGDHVVTVKPRHDGRHSQFFVLVEPVFLNKQMVLDLGYARWLPSDPSSDR